MRPFLTSTRLFSSVSPRYKDYLDEEMYGCFKRVGVPYDTLFRMPVKERRNIIRMYNKDVAEQNRRYQELMNKK